MSSITSAGAGVFPPVPEIEEIRTAATLLWLKNCGDLTVTDDGQWLANAGERWVAVGQDKAEAYFAHPAVTEAVTDLCVVLAGQHYARVMAAFEEQRAGRPAAYTEAVEPFFRAHAELDISRDDANAAMARINEEMHAGAVKQAGPPRFVRLPMTMDHSDEWGAF